MKLDKNIPDWNKDGIWKNVDSKLHQRRKKRAIYWWLSGTTGAAILIVVLFWSIPLQESIITNSKYEMIIADGNETRELKRENSIANSFSTKNKNKDQSTNRINSKTARQLNSYEKLTITNTSFTTDTYHRDKTASIAKMGSAIYSIGAPPEKERLTNEKVNTKSNLVINPLDTLPIEPVAILPIKIDWETQQQLYFSRPYKFQKAERKKNRYSLWLESGISTGSKSGGIINGLITGEEITGQFRFMQTNTIGIQKFIGNNLSIKIGLGYQTIYEKYEYNSTTSIEEDVFVEDGTVYELANGVTYTEPGLIRRLTTHERSVINNNFTHRFSVPLELVYIFQRNKWSMEFATGTRFLFFQNFDGIATNEQTLLRNQKEINDLYFANKFNLGLLASLNLNYSISPKGSLGLKFMYEKDDFLGLSKTEFLNRYETIGAYLGYYQSL